MNGMPVLCKVQIFFRMFDTLGHCLGGGGRGGQWPKLSQTPFLWKQSDWWRALGGHTLWPLCRTYRLHCYRSKGRWNLFNYYHIFNNVDSESFRYPSFLSDSGIDISCDKPPHTIVKRDLRVPPIQIKKLAFVDIYFLYQKVQFG